MKHTGLNEDDDRAFKGAIVCTGEARMPSADWMRPLIEIVPDDRMRLTKIE